MRLVKLLGETLARGEGTARRRARVKTKPTGIRRMTSRRTFESLLAPARDEAAAIAAPDAPPLTYAGLRALVDETVARAERLRRRARRPRRDRAAERPGDGDGVHRVASGATSAPLNPAYRADEFEFYLSDLGAKALIVEAGSASPALDAAEKLGIALI